MERLGEPSLRFLLRLFELNEHRLNLCEFHLGLQNRFQARLLTRRFVCRGRDGDHVPQSSFQFLVHFDGAIEELQFVVGQLDLFHDGQFRSGHSREGGLGFVIGDVAA